MYKRFQSRDLAQAINSIIIPEFEDYLNDKRNALEKEVNVEINHIEELEDLIYEMTVNKDFSKLENDNYIQLDGYIFNYNKETEEFEYIDNKLNSAQSRIYSKKNLYNNWRTTTLLKERILAILVTLQETSWEETLNIVKSKIDFDEFIKF